ncbi:hypothetical protein GGS20DRAFT_270248 [Poronia punctata]|nr:hypothetical protein GGS20DRAFT_270248 [Poronia punctata]
MRHAITFLLVCADPLCLSLLNRGSCLVLQALLCCGDAPPAKALWPSLQVFGSHRWIQRTTQYIVAFDVGAVIRRNIVLSQPQQNTIDHQNHKSPHIRLLFPTIEPALTSLDPT